MNIKIVLACHKPCYLIKEKNYFPLHVGKKINSSIMDCTGDDETDLPDGEISAKNKSLNEMTAVYWAWKNYEKLGSPKYIGFGHYRRQFIFNRTLPRPVTREVKDSRYFAFPDYKSVLPYIEISAGENLLAKYDILTTQNYDARGLCEPRFYTNCKSRFYAMADFQPDLYDLMEELVLEKHSDFLLEVEELRQKPSHYRCNMFVMKKEDFFRYCEFIFPILFALDDANAAETRTKEMRAPGYLAEFLTTMFILHCARAEGKRVKELDTAFVEYTDGFELRLGLGWALSYLFALCVCVCTFGKRGRHRMKCLRWKREVRKGMRNYGK